jgi:ABC-type glycerol-3-phosphate transport system substrate-binding protein
LAAAAVVLVTHDGQWGLAVEGGNVSENAHQAFTFAQQYGADFFDAAGKPQFDSPGAVAGIKRYLDFLAVDKIVLGNTQHKAAALKFVEFMTSDAEQITLNKAYSSLPTVQGAYADAAFQTDQVKVFQNILATTAAPLPAVPEESQFGTLVGTAMKDLFADAASGKAITADAIKAKLSAANQQVKAGG